MRKPTSTEEKVFSIGPKILPKAALLSFLRHSTGTLQIPAVIVRGEHPLAPYTVFIGVSDELDGTDRIMLSLQDTAMGTGVSSLLHDLFPDQKTCHVWLIGRMGPLLPQPSFLGTTDKEIFSVHLLRPRTDGPTDNNDASIWI